MTVDPPRYQKARQVADIPFPFHVNQMVHLLLTSFVLATPFVVLFFVKNLFLSVVLNLAICVGFIVMNAISIELEDPSALHFFKKYKYNILLFIIFES